MLVSRPHSLPMLAKSLLLMLQLKSIIVIVLRLRVAKLVGGVPIVGELVLIPT